MTGGTARTRPSKTAAHTVRPPAPEPLSPQDLLSLYRPDISQALRNSEVAPYRYAQVAEHLFSRPLQPFAEATTLPTDFRASLDVLGATVLASVGERSAPDGTVKFLLAGADGAIIESVFMRYRDRATACISSQVGCAVGCAFCATGAMGFGRNLSVAEIVDQVRTAQAHAKSNGLRLSNLVFMGMGEPLLNLRAVLDSIRVIADPKGLGLSRRSLSVSTVGIPAGIRTLARSEPQVNLAVSLHAADDRTRALLIPQTFRHTLTEVLEAAWDHFAVTGRKLLVEYVLLQGVNDSVDDARRLAGLLRGHVVTVNLLPWNPVRSAGRTGTGSAAATQPRPPSFRAPPTAAVVAFREALLSARVEAVVRRSKGAGIDAACGQLAGRQVPPKPPRADRDHAEV